MLVLEFSLHDYQKCLKLDKTSCLFQDQLREVQEFQSKVGKYRPKMEGLSDLATVADPSNEAAAGTKMKELQERYDRLQALLKERRGLLSDFLPSVQQYESSRGAWQDLLCGWEEKTEQLAPPFATPETILKQLEEVKVCVK